MHKTTGRWLFGFFLALLTATLWGLLPIALKRLLISMDANTVTWYRFSIAAISLLVYICLTPKAGCLPRSFNSMIGLMCIAIFGLTSNYIFYLKGLEYSTPETAQVVIQLAPMLLMLGGLLIFKERFNHWQWFGLVMFVTGIALFFNHHIMEPSTVSTRYLLGIALVILASVTWAIYALAQKQLLNQLNSNIIMLFIYIAGGLLFLPVAQPLQIIKLDDQGLFLLAFCCTNTLLAYGSFAEALNHLEASRVSAVLAITPILTILFSYLIDQFFPGVIELDAVNLTSILGACLMIIGSMLTALSQQK